MIGETLGHYRIVEKIGAGGMGVVYRARDERLERDVALKILPAGLLSDVNARKRFRKEALALAKLNHPNIGVVYDFDTQEGVDFLVMEYIAGAALAEKLAGRSLSVKEVITLGAQMAAALEEAHDHGVVHRDLKPGNILVTPKGQAKVLDFGLAQLLQPASETTSTTDVLADTAAVAGTLPYMAPEQLRGEAADVRTDLYALGVVLYEMATGRRPFGAALPTALAADIQHKVPASPGRLNPELPSELERIILKCLEKDPENRYQSARELAIDLRRLAAPSATGIAETPTPRRRIGLRRPVLSGSLAVVVLLVVLAGLNVGGWRERLRGRPATPRIESIAVLPLENLSRDPEQEYFADGMTEELITELAKIGALRVISRTSVMRYKGTSKALPEIARELNVDAVVEGSVQRSGNRVRINTQLINAPMDKHLWAESYERDMGDVLALQGEVARAIAKEIKVKLTPQEQARLASARSVNPEAHELYLKGRYYWNKRTLESFQKAIEYFQKALEKDPKYGLAYAGLADCYAKAAPVNLAGLSLKEAQEKARAAAMKALELDNSLAEAHTSLGVVLRNDWDLTGSERELKRAIELNPSYAWARENYADYLIVERRLQEGIAEAQHALELDPVSLDANKDLGWIFYIARQYDQALGQLQKTLEMDPNFVFTHFWLGFVYERKGMFDQAISEFQKAVSLTSGDPEMTLLLARAFAVSGDKLQARKLLKTALGSGRRMHLSPVWIAVTYESLGERDEAFKWLTKGYEERSDDMLYLKVEPVFVSLRFDPRFAELLRRVHIPQ